MKSRLLIGAFAALQASCAYAASNDPVEYLEYVGAWRIAGDFDVGACIATGLIDRQSKLIIMVDPNSSEYTFALSNPAWTSIKNDESMLISALLLRQIRTH